MHTSFDGKVDVEFDFWGASETQYYSNDTGASEVEFQAQVEEDFVDYSLPLWKTDLSRNVRNESSPLLPRGHHYSNISPRSRLQVMAEGRRKLMEIVHSMPESSYELSLKDIVDEQQISEGAQDEMPKQRTTSDFKSEAQIIKKQKTKKTKSFSMTIWRPCQVAGLLSVPREAEGQDSKDTSSKLGMQCDDFCNGVRISLRIR
ncbi:hypothetical protein D5086_010124 [Populus alba]|uniref:Uncharacterized protein n=1 Tax=Populus alba TaxID=43335 RepID=A0ACC4C9B7_POPAL